MSRDSGGTYTSPSGQFTPGTTILSNVVNSKFNDLGDEITNSLDRNGKGGMLTYLRGVDGTINLPAYSFTSDITSGLRLAGSGDVRMSKDGTDLQKWSTAEVRIYSAGVMEKGLTVTNSTSSGAGLTVTGNGTGDGVVATGGATGDGGTFSGGATGGRGLVVTGTGSSANGIQVTAGASAKAIEVTTGAAYGLYARAGIGLDVLASSGVGASITGGASSAGAVLTGGSGAVGAQIAAGTAATGADPTNAMELTNGNLKLSGAAPNSTEALVNTITPADIAQVTGTIELTAANTASVTRGKNIASVAINPGSDTLIVTYANAFANDDYTVVMGGNALVLVITKTTTTTAFQFFAPGSATAADLDNAGVAIGLTMNIACYGAMA